MPALSVQQQQARRDASARPQHVAPRPRPTTARYIWSHPTVFPLTPISAHVIPYMPSSRRPAPLGAIAARDVDWAELARSQGSAVDGVRRGSSNGMDRFVSTFINKLDAKGRVSVPAPFRTILERDGYAG